MHTHPQPPQLIENLLDSPRRCADHLKPPSITTTVDLYGHLVPEATTAPRDALDSAFGRAGTCARNVPGLTLV
jgi:hypothetical protein